MKSLREMEIVEFINQRKCCSMSELMRQFNVSPATIHRDVAGLARKKLIQKVHGGVAVVQIPAAPKHEPGNAHFSARINKNIEKKLLIAESAQQYIGDGDIIFLDSSTTSLHLARRIRKMKLSNLTIITNSVLIIQEFQLFPPHYFLISLGGTFDLQLNACLGRTTIDNLKRLKINKAFFSAVGISPNGVFTYHENHAEFLKEVLSISENKYLLVDSSKFDREGIFTILPLSKVDYLISDRKAPEYAIAATNGRPT
jgi:DeoR family myo-inositol catabolism operon transcriptional repressor